MAEPTLPSSRDRRRRRRLRLIPIIGYTVAALGLAYLLAEQPTTTAPHVPAGDEVERVTRRSGDAGVVNFIR